MHDLLEFRVQLRWWDLICCSGEAICEGYMRRPLAAFPSNISLRVQWPLRVQWRVSDYHYRQSFAFDKLRLLVHGTKH